MRPVARDHAPRPHAHAREVGAADVHPGGAALVEEARDRDDDVRVLGGVDVQAGRQRTTAGGSGSARPARGCRRRAPWPPDAAHEAPDLQREVVAQQVVAAVDGRRGGVHQPVPVDLVETDRRVAPEPPGHRAADAVLDSGDGRGGEVELAARAPGGDEPVDHLGVEHEVLVGARGRVHRARPSRARGAASRAGAWRGRRTAPPRRVSRAAIRRARWSLRAGPSWPRWAATAWVSRSEALTAGSVPEPPGRYISARSSQIGVEALLGGVGEAPVAGFVEPRCRRRAWRWRGRRRRGRARARAAASGGGVPQARQHRGAPSRAGERSPRWGWAYPAGRLSAGGCDKHHAPIRALPRWSLPPCRPGPAPLLAPVLRRRFGGRRPQLFSR